MEWGTLEFFKDGTVSINGFAYHYSFPDESHLKIQGGEGGGILYEYSLSGDKLILKSGEEIRVYMPYKEFTPSPKSIAGTWYGGYGISHRFFKDLGIGMIDLPQINFGEDGSFSLSGEEDWGLYKYSLSGKFSINHRNLHISASGNERYLFGGEKKLQGESVCYIELLTNSKLVLKDDEGKELKLFRSLKPKKFEEIK